MFRNLLRVAGLVTLLMSAYASAQSPTFTFTAIPDQD